MSSLLTALSHAAVPSTLPQGAPPVRHYLKFDDFTADETMYLMERAAFIKHKFKTHISSSSIFEEFCRRSAVESHHGVVAVFHKASGGSVYLDRPELVAFLNRLREDRKSAAGCGDVSGVLQKFVTPPTQFDECHVVTFDINSGMTVHSHASKQQLWGTSINVQRRCDLLGGKLLNHYAKPVSNNASSGYPEDALKVAIAEAYGRA